MPWRFCYERESGFSDRSNIPTHKMWRSRRSLFLFPPGEKTFDIRLSQNMRYDALGERDIEQIQASTRIGLRFEYHELE